MDMELFEFLCRVSLGVAIFGILFIGLGLVLRACIREEDEIRKWNFLRAVEEVDKQEHCPRRDDRIRAVKDQTQRGDAS
jgi:predicted Fe-S protein YdhL (DUF1289 family)